MEKFHTKFEPRRSYKIVPIKKKECIGKTHADATYAARVNINIQPAISVCSHGCVLEGSNQHQWMGNLENWKF